MQQAIQYAEKQCIKAGILAVDFQKAFNSLEHSYLWQVLQQMGFGEVFIGMVKTFYKGARSAVINGGVTTRYFNLERSARQGDPLSPILFILALEPLIRLLKKEIKGIKTPMGYFKLVLFADDLTVGLGQTDKLCPILHTLARFGTH